MTKQRRHATRIDGRQRQPLTKIRESIALLLPRLADRCKSLSLPRLSVIPTLIVAVATCSLVLGISNSSDGNAVASQNFSHNSNHTVEVAESKDSRIVALNLVTTNLATTNLATTNPVATDLATSDLVATDLVTTDAATDEPTTTEANQAKQSVSESDRYQVGLDLKAALVKLNDDTEKELPSHSLREEKLKVKSGDTLSTLFQQVGLGAQTVYRITHSSDAGKSLTKVFPGEKLVFEFDHNNELQTITRIKSELKKIKFIASANGFESETIILEPEVRQVTRSGSIHSSLSLAAFDAGLSSSTTMNMANIFGGVMDFALDVRPNDEFTIIYEELYLDGKKIDDGNIIAAQYVNSGKLFNAFRFEDSKGDIGYFNEDGESMRKVFLRAPLDFTRVSSGFNLRRLHPITKRVKPHRGIDYAAPTGTPIFSVGDGRVSSSGYNKSNGNYVFIRHGESYVTKYLHLKKRNVKKGQRVKQGQIIGSVGCTGLCTGPHLHYEFLVNGVHRNPRTIVSKLPKAKRLAESELPEFAQATRGQQDMLSHYGYQTAVALSD